MKVTQSVLEEGLSHLGLKSGDSVLVHSLLSSFGFVDGGAITVIDSFLNVLKDEGLLIVPTLTGKITDCRDKPPIFDVKTTPCWTGKIPETFRMMKQAVRSLHPTHSVAAIGDRKYELTRLHETGLSPCDDKSPYGPMSIKSTN
ncbi:MAG TPA: AAC(3) family N-acetyltransferase [Clostridiaceae bacterium]